MATLRRLIRLYRAPISGRSNLNYA